jgi:hypothetical protein
MASREGEAPRSPPSPDLSCHHGQPREGEREQILSSSRRLLGTYREGLHHLRDPAPSSTMELGGDPQQHASRHCARAPAGRPGHLRLEPATEIPTKAPSPPPPATKAGQGSVGEPQWEAKRRDQALFTESRHGGADVRHSDHWSRTRASPPIASRWIRPRNPGFYSTASRQSAGNLL